MSTYAQIRRYSEDVLGNILTKGKYNRVLRYYFDNIQISRKNRKPFGYRVDIKNPRRRRRYFTRYGKIVATRRKLALFYQVSAGYLKRIKNVLRKRMSISGKNVLYILESRFSTIVYRMHLACSVTEACKLIKSRMFLINKKVIIKPDYLLQSGDVIELNPLYKKQMVNIINKRVHTQRALAGIPNYLHVNFSIMGAIFLGNIRLRTVALPFKYTGELISSVVLRK